VAKGIAMGRAGVWALVGSLGLAAAAGLGWWAVRPGPTPAGSAPDAPAASVLTLPFTLEDAAAAAGVTFRHEDGATPNYYVPEIMGSGVAWLDYDRDGFPDLFLVQGGRFPPDPNDPAGPTSRLYRNRGDGTFADVTAEVGIRTPGYGQGVAVGDYDNDGYPDLFVTHCHGGRLYHNEPGPAGRRFRDATAAAGLALDGWCTSAAFGDLHGAGHLDLFVCRYLPLDLANYPVCTEDGPAGPIRTVCGPEKFPGTRSSLFRNNGDGTFTDVTEPAGIEPDGKALGVVILDLNDDGRADVFVGNDEVPNHHYRNLGGGRFRSVGLRSGTAVNRNGRPMGSMGIEAGDLFGTGRPDLFVTTYVREGTAVFQNRGGGSFLDVSPGAGMFAASWPRVGWGTALFDPDGDGTLDLFVANGHTRRNAAEMAVAETGRPQEYAQLPQLFLGDGRGGFRDVSAAAGPYLREPHVGRGVALADSDNDGAPDLAVTHVGGPAALLRTVRREPRRWVRLELEGARHRDPAGANRDAVGAVVTVRAGGRTLVRHLKGGGSYYSAHDTRLLVGLGDAAAADEVEVRWPNAARTVQRFGPLAADRGYRLLEGVADPQPAR
jgi:hypothetical protein